MCSLGICACSIHQSHEQRTDDFLYDRSDGRSRGWGTLGYDTEEEMQKAIAALNGLQFNSRIIEVREDKKPMRF